MTCHSTGKYPHALTIWKHILGHYETPETTTRYDMS